MNKSWEVSLEHCLEAFAGARLLDLGCGVGALLAHLRRTKQLDWSGTFGVTSVHSFDISMFAAPAGDHDMLLLNASYKDIAFGCLKGDIGPPEWLSCRVLAFRAVPPGHPDFFERHLLRFNLDCLAEHAEKARSGSLSGCFKGARLETLRCDHLTLLHLGSPLMP